MGLVRKCLIVFFSLMLFDRQLVQCIELSHQFEKYLENNHQNYVLKPDKSTVLCDFEHKALVYKDLIESKCFLEILATKDNILECKLSNYVDGIKKPLTNRQLSKREIWQLAGQNILDFCRGYPTYLIQQIDDRIFLVHNEVDARSKREASPYQYEKVHGQTQSQYLNFDGSTNQEGIAEAEINFNGTRAVVSGSNGMGQAQSQSAPVDCRECRTNNGEDQDFSFTNSGGQPKINIIPFGESIETGRPSKVLKPTDISRGSQVDPGGINAAQQNFGELADGDQRFYPVPGEINQFTVPPTKLEPITGISGAGGVSGQINTGYGYIPPGSVPGGQHGQFPYYVQSVTPSVYQPVQPGQQITGSGYSQPILNTGVGYHQVLPNTGVPPNGVNIYPGVNSYIHPESTYNGQNLPANLIHTPLHQNTNLGQSHQVGSERISPLSQGKFGGQVSGQYASQIGQSGRFSGTFQGNFQADHLPLPSARGNIVDSHKISSTQSIPLNYEIQTQTGSDQGTIGKIQQNYSGDLTKLPNGQRIISNSETQTLIPSGQVTTGGYPTAHFQNFPQNLQTETTRITPGATYQYPLGTNIQYRPEFATPTQVVPAVPSQSLQNVLTQRAPQNIAGVSNQYEVTSPSQVVPGRATQILPGSYFPNTGVPLNVYQGAGVATAPQKGAIVPLYPQTFGKYNNLPNGNSGVVTVPHPGGNTYINTYPAQSGGNPGTSTSYIPGVYPQYVTQGTPGTAPGQYTRITDTGNQGAVNSNQLGTGQQVGQTIVGGVSPGQHPVNGEGPLDGQIGENDDSDSQVQSSVHQTDNETIASAQAQGKFQGGTSQSQVSGTYSGSGSFSASAGSDDGKRGALTQVSGGKEGAQSSAQGRGGAGQSQVQVILDSNSGDTSSSAQTSGIQHGTQTKVSASDNGGVADAQANGLGATSSQAQIGFSPPSENDDEKDQTSLFRGGGKAEAQSGARSGMTQTQIQGKLRYGIKYQGAAQAGSGNTTLKNLTLPSEFFKPLNLPTTKSTGKIQSQSQKAVIIPEAKNRINHAAVDLQLSETTRQSDVNSTERAPAFVHAQIEENDDQIEDDFYSDDYDDQDVLNEDIPSGYNGTPSKRNSTPQNDVKRNSGKKAPNLIMQASPTQTQQIILDPLEDLDATVHQSRNEQIESETILQPGESFPGSGYKIPIGFRGRVKSHANGENTYAIGRNSQAQSVTLSPGKGGISYQQPAYAVSTRTLYKDGGYGTGYSYRPITYKFKSGSSFPDFVSLSKSEVGSKNLRTGKKIPKVHYTQSSSCGMFTNSCIYIDGKKNCFPVRQTNPDGSFKNC